MAVTIDAGSRRPVIVYIIVAVILFAALLLGVRFAKGRASYYGQTQTQNSQNQTATSNQPAQTQQPADTSNSQNQVARNNASSSSSSTQPTTASTAPATSPAAATPSRVPSTGPEQFILPIASLSVFVFASLSYARARRRLQTLA